MQLNIVPQNSNSGQTQKRKKKKKLTGHEEKPKFDSLKNKSEMYTACTTCFRKKSLKSENLILISPLLQPHGVSLRLQLRS